VVIQAIMPRTLKEIQKDGWNLLAVGLTHEGGNYFVFRRPKQ